MNRRVVVDRALANAVAVARESSDGAAASRVVHVALTERAA